ncbi:hypothetical protein PsYK624_033980 [Phanerochaete sordida]|uniref:Uncharacterized protein n=1 Tax=Phanerochaete sordida TaxID=48140 RepID=A0A9P3G488_9APHY|nr:hypothetical protein PsYK624_033980 [Phanerochaete sordida]
MRASGRLIAVDLPPYHHHCRRRRYLCYLRHHRGRAINIRHAIQWRDSSWVAPPPSVMIPGGATQAKSRNPRSVIWRRSSSSTASLRSVMIPGDAA